MLEYYYKLLKSGYLDYLWDTPTRQYYERYTGRSKMMKKNLRNKKKGLCNRK